MAEHHRDERNGEQSDKDHKEPEHDPRRHKPALFLPGFVQFTAAERRAEDNAGRRCDAAECHEKEIGNGEARRHTGDDVRAPAAIVKRGRDRFGNDPEHFRAKHHRALFEHAEEEREIYAHKLFRRSGKRRALDGNENEKHRHFRETRDDRGDGRALYLEPRRAEIAVDQHPVEKRVDERGNNGDEKRRTHPADLAQGRRADRGNGHGNTVEAHEEHVLHGLVQYGVRLRVADDHEREYLPREHHAHEKIQNDRRRREHRLEAQRLTHAAFIARAVILRHEDAARGADRIEQHHENKEDLPGDIDAGHFHVAEARDHEVVDERHHVLNEHLQHDRQRDEQRLFIKARRAEEFALSERCDFHRPVFPPDKTSESQMILSTLPEKVNRTKFTIHRALFSTICSTSAISETV